MYRAALGPVDFSIFLVGTTGVFKTAVAALCQQHFGATMDARHLPSSFASTPSALENPAFYAKDALLVVDDFAPTGRYRDTELQNVAERLFRAVGNRQGRSRSNSGSNTPKPPRALMLATGEEVPQGQSIRARLLIVEVGRGDIDRARLSECQRYGDDGHFAVSMSGFLRWIANRYEEIQGRLRTRLFEIRSKADPIPAHARLPGTLAELQVGWEIFLDFAVETGAIDATEKENLELRGRTAFRTLGTLQTKYQSSGDPASHFIASLRTALVCGQAHVADRLGNAPKDASSWGWRRRSHGQWIPLGSRIGWLVGTDLYLDSAASYRVAREACERFPVSEQALRHQLRERGFLVSTDKGRGMVQVRRRLDCASKQVLHLRASDIVCADSSSTD